jgi:hypothetical protein
MAAETAAVATTGCYYCTSQVAAEMCRQVVTNFLRMDAVVAFLQTKKVLVRTTAAGAAGSLQRTAVADTVVEKEERRVAAAAAGFHMADKAFAVVVANEAGRVSRTEAAQSNSYLGCSHKVAADHTVVAVAAVEFHKAADAALGERKCYWVACHTSIAVEAEGVRTHYCSLVVVVVHKRSFGPTPLVQNCWEAVAN